LDDGIRRRFEPNAHLRPHVRDDYRAEEEAGIRQILGTESAKHHIDERPDVDKH